MWWGALLNHSWPQFLWEAARRKSLLFLKARYLEGKRQTTEKKKKKTTMKHENVLYLWFLPWHWISTQIFWCCQRDEIGWANLLACCSCLYTSPVSSEREQTWEVVEQAWHAKCIPCCSVMWKMIIIRIIHAVLLAVSPKAVKEPGE